MTPRQKNSHTKTIGDLWVLRAGSGWERVFSFTVLKIGGALR